MNHRWPRRLSASRVAGTSGAAAAGLVVALIALSSCSQGSASPGVTVVAAGTSTTFRTEPVRTTTTTQAPPPDVGGDGESGDGDGGDDPVNSGAESNQPDEESTGERSYQVRGGDYLVGIARQFDVTADAIAAYNGWESVQHSLQPGDTIRIPPEDWDRDEATAGSGPDAGTAVEGSSAGDGTCPDGSEQETYTIQAGDVKGTVARRFDVTVAELDAANAGTQYYAGFVIGVEILIPC